MIYKSSSQSLIYSLRWVSLLALPILFLIVFSGSDRIIFGALLIFLLLSIPQIFLVFQYERVSKFDSFQIDEERGTINILMNGSIIQRNIADLKNVQYHHAVVPRIYLSLLLKMCEHFYYYKFEFKDNSIYYLTSLVLPEPSFAEKGIFYSFYIDVERTYPRIK